MTNSISDQNEIIDIHFHVGLIGDQFPEWGKLSEWYRNQLTYKIFLLYTGIKESDVNDEKLFETTKKVIEHSSVDRVVCLALDPVYDLQGKRHEDRSHVWVDNEYILHLQEKIGNKVLFGASVHPYDIEFKQRVKRYQEKGAVLLKWVPSSQQINLAENIVGDALLYLAELGLPLLLHVGPEYAIPTSDERTRSYDFLCWNLIDKVSNIFRGKKKWHRPQVIRINENLQNAIDKGATIIFAHCGLPYFAPYFLKRIIEHSDFKVVKKYLEKYEPTENHKGSCYADVSAFVTPFRCSYFKKVAKLPKASLLYGSDFPTPTFELSADLGEVWKDFKAVLKGHFEHIIVPQDNLLDVNLRELQHIFHEHPLFTNFNRLI